MKTLRLVFVVLAMFCFVSSIACAQEMNRGGACRADIEKFCKDVQPGQGRIAQCIKRHEAELSPACEEHIYAEKEKVKEFIKACKPDAEKLCKGVVAGKGRIYRCLKANEAQLSPDCRAHLKK
jgi:hypothetical protein